MELLQAPHPLMGIEAALTAPLLLLHSPGVGRDDSRDVCVPWEAVSSTKTGTTVSMLVPHLTRHIFKFSYGLMIQCKRVEWARDVQETNWSSIGSLIWC